MCIWTELAVSIIYIVNNVKSESQANNRVAADLCYCYWFQNRQYMYSSPSIPSSSIRTHNTINVT